MAGVNVSIRMDSELTAQAEQVLSQLGMNMTVPSICSFSRSSGIGQYPLLS